MIQERPLTPRPSRRRYYATSAWTMIAGIRSPARLARLLADRPADPVVVQLRTSGLRFPVRDFMDAWILKEVCLDRDYERVGTPLENGWTILDIGAGIGAFAADAASRCPASTVYAFEPSPASFALLRLTLQLNGVRNVRAVDWAVGPSDGRAWLDVSSSPLTHRLTGAGSAGAGALEVRQETLAGVFRQLEIATCDFLKMDVEGGEYGILLAADQATLSRIRRMSLEYHDGPTHGHDEIVDCLERAGFTVTVSPSPAYRELGFIYAQRQDP